MTFASLVEGWALDRRPTEKTRYTMGVRAGLLAKHLGHEDAARVTADDLRAWRQALLAEGKAASTAANYLNDVKTLLRWAAEAGRLPANPAEGVRAPKRKRKAADRRLPFSDEEARLILEKARELRGADRWMPWLLAFTGARVEEVAQALVADVRERDGIVYLDINAEGAGKSLKNAGSARRGAAAPGPDRGGLPGLRRGAAAGTGACSRTSIRARSGTRARRTRSARGGGSGGSGSRTGARWRTTRGGTGSRTCAGTPGCRRTCTTGSPGHARAT